MENQQKKRNGSVELFLWAVLLLVIFYIEHKFLMFFGL